MEFDVVPQIENMRINELISTVKDISQSWIFRSKDGPQKNQWVMKEI